MDWQKNTLATLNVALMRALDVALLEICRIKQSEAEEWLDGFERRVVLATKNIVIEGMSLEQEARAMNAAAETIKMIIQETKKKARRRNAKNNPRAPR